MAVELVDSKALKWVEKKVDLTAEQTAPKKAVSMVGSRAAM